MVLISTPLAIASGRDGAGDLQMRLAIRRATLPLFAGRGYDDTSIDDIVAAAEISRRTFFRHFEGKHQILSADHEVHLAAVVDHLSRHENERTISRAGHALVLLLDALAADPDEARTRLRVLSATTVLQAEELRWGKRYRQALAQFLDGTEATTIGAEMAAGALMGAAETVLRDWLLVDGPPPTETFLKAVAAAISVAGGFEYPTRRHVAIVETNLTAEEIAERLRD